MNCIFMNWNDSIYLLLESIFIYGNLDEYTDIVLPIQCNKQSHLFNERIKFGMDVSYNKILYLEDCIVKEDINVFHRFEGDIYVKDLENVIQSFTCIDTMRDAFIHLKDSTIEQNIIKTKHYIDTYLLDIIRNSGEKLEGNIFMTHHTTEYTDKFINKTKNISNLVLNKDIKTVMEIGFNAGFSTLLMLLSNDTIKITCYDLGEHLYTRPCFEKLKETFGDRIHLVIGDSTKTLKDVNETYDIIHIDGGHSTEVAQSDIVQSYRLAKKGTIFIMDDYNFENLHTLWDEYSLKYDLKPLDITLYNSPHHDIKYKN